MVSRAKRASETASKLRAIAEQLRELADLRDEPELKEIADTIEEQAGELESIDFPTMYG